MKNDSHEFLVKTNREVDEWMDSFFVDGRKSDFRLTCQWAWQEQERRKDAIVSDLLAALQAMELEYGGLGEYDLDFSEPVKMAQAAIAKALGKDQ